MAGAATSLPKPRTSMRGAQKPTVSRHSLPQVVVDQPVQVADQEPAVGLEHVLRLERRQLARVLPARGRCAVKP